MDVFYIEANLRLTEDVEYALDVADRMAKESDVRYTHDEVFSKLRGASNSNIDDCSIE